MAAIARNVSANRVRSVRNFFLDAFEHSDIHTCFDPTRLFDPPGASERWILVEIAETRAGYPNHSILTVHCCAKGGMGEGVDVAEVEDAVWEALDAANWRIPLSDYREDPPEIRDQMRVFGDSMTVSSMLEAEGVRFRSVSFPLVFASAY